MSNCHSCIAAARCQRTYSERRLRRGRSTTSPWRTRMRCTVAREGIGSGRTGARMSSCTIRCAPQRGCARRSSHTRPSTSAATRPGLDRGRRERSASPASPASRYLATHACTDWRYTPTSAAISVTAAPSSTAITALYRCSITDNATNANPGLPPKARKPITASGVNHLLRLSCQACRETGQQRRADCWYALLYVFKGGGLRPPPAPRCGRPQAAVLAAADMPGPRLWQSSSLASAD